MPRTVIGRDTRVGGPLTGKDDLVIEGLVDGAVIGEGSVTIAPGGRVNGEVRAREVTIGGLIHHPVHAQVSIHVLATAEVLGDLYAPRIAIDDGAMCEGALRMGRKPAETPRATETPRAAEPPPPATGDARPVPVLPAIGKRRLFRR